MIDNKKNVGIRESNPYRGEMLKIRYVTLHHCPYAGNHTRPSLCNKP